MIQLNHVTMAFTKDYNALHDINLTIQKGENVCILGSENSGKTCLLHLILGLEKVQKGEVLVLNHPVSKINFKEDLSAVFITEHGVFLENKTVHQNLVYVLQKREKTEGDVSLIVDSCLRNFGLEPYAQTKVKALNPFNRTLLALARASFRQSVELLVIDSVFDTLNAAESEQIMKYVNPFLKDKDTTVLITTGQEKIAHEIGGRIVKLDLGAIYETKY